MAVTKLFYPGFINWSRNYMRFSFQYQVSAADQRLQMQILDTSGNVIADQLYPLNDYFGVVHVGIDQLLDPVLKYRKPQNVTAATELNEYIFSYGLVFTMRYREYSATVTNAWINDNQQYRVVKGGIGDLYMMHEQFRNGNGNALNIENFNPIPGQFLTWLPSGRQMAPDEYSWLLYCNLQTHTNQRLQYILHYTDYTIATISKDLDQFSFVLGIAEPRGWQFYIPTGIQQAKLDNVNPLKKIAFYDIRVINTISGIAYATHTIYADYRPNYHPLTMHYRNSVGGWDNFRFRGEIERNVDTEKLEYQTTRLFSDNGETPYYDSSIKLKWKANTGNIAQSHMTALIDMLNSTECALLIGGKWIPVRITGKTLKYNSTKDALHNALIEFETSGTYRSLPYQLTTLPL